MSPSFSYQIMALKRIWILISRLQSVKSLMSWVILFTDYSIEFQNKIKNFQILKKHWKTPKKWIFTNLFCIYLYSNFIASISNRLSCPKKSIDFVCSLTSSNFKVFLFNHERWPVNRHEGTDRRKTKVWNVLHYFKNILIIRCF